MTHEDYKELLTANALSALDTADGQALELHLQECDECRLEKNDLEGVVALMSFSATPREPSPVLRDQILARVRTEGITKARDDAPAPPGANTFPPRVLPFEQPRPNIWTSLGSFGAIAAAITLVGLSVSLLVLWRQNRAVKSELAQLVMQVREKNDELARERAVVALLTSPGARMTELAGTNAAPGAHAMLAYDKTGHAMLMAKGLPAAPAGKAYQLWFIMGNRKMPGKMFSTDTNGNGTLEDQIPMAAIGSAVFAITLEPETGVQVPTGAVYLVSSS